MPKKTIAKKKKTQAKKRPSKTKKTLRLKKKKTALSSREKVSVSFGPSNVLDKKEEKEQEFLETREEQAEVPQFRELVWTDFYNQEKQVESTNLFQSDSSLNFISRKNKSFSFINLLASLPKDFFVFYGKKIKIVLGITQWTLEEIGKLPFRLILWILSFLELFLARPIWHFLLMIAKKFWLSLRHVHAYLFWMIKNGILTIFGLPGKTAKFLKPAPTNYWSRGLVSFVLACLIIVLPFGTYTYITKLKDTQGLVLGAATQAYEQLQAAQAATSELDFETAGEEFRKADESFGMAKERLANIDFLISGIINNLSKGKAAGKLLETGELISEAGVEMSEGLAILSEHNTDDLDDAVSGGRQVDNTDMPMHDIDLGVSDKIKILEDKFSRAYPKIVLARKNIEEIDPKILPEANQDNFFEMKAKILGVEAVAKKLYSFSKIISELFAIDTSKRYLVVFQNEDELRPAGGFMGSFALLDVLDGKISQIEIPGGGPYDFQESLVKRVAPPKPLQLVNNQWEMQDANWFGDFETTAKKIMWFYENSGGPTVDGVITITSGLIPPLLEITGPIEMLEYDKVITADNFQIETQLAVELEYDREENRPKQFIADLTPRLLEKLINLKSDKLIDLLGVIDLGLTRKKIMFYFGNDQVQAEAVENNWAGKIKQVGEEDDFLLVLNANIGGGKTDNVITQKIVHETEVLENGEVVDTVTIIRTHGGGAGYFFANRKNINYARVYVPQGSTLIEAKGFYNMPESSFRELAPALGKDSELEKIEGQVLVDEVTGTRITTEFGKTVFGNWMILNPGETTVSKFRYRLPYKLNLRIDDGERSLIYALLIQKQAGTKDDEIEKIIILPKNFNSVWKYPEEDYIGEYEGMVKFKSNLVTDRYYGVVFR
ncbi:DUF4012 domain-containing protein [Candidatus Falkowbacteria bacterium]|nr:DUF4012 domain-containing protein [Candidatus Falkowbacteria bacterium]